MAFHLVAGAWTREALKVPSIDRTGAGGVIGHVNAANYTGSSDTIFEGPPNGWRADRQNPSTPHANIQIQKNGVFNQKSSIGGVLVPLDLAKQIGSVNAAGPTGLVAKARFLRTHEGYSRRAIPQYWFLALCDGRTAIVCGIPALHRNRRIFRLRQQPLYRSNNRVCVMDRRMLYPSCDGTGSNRTGRTSDGRRIG